MTKVNLNKLSDNELKTLAETLQVLDTKRKYNTLEFCFTETGPNRRELYKKHLMFFEAGNSFKERAIIAGNRTGKSFAASYEMALHLTGKYPTWWRGKKFEFPIQAWSVGQTLQTTRDILQTYLYGVYHDPGTGMIPKDDIFKATSKHGSPNAVQDLLVKHYTAGAFDGYSELTFKSYDQGIESFMGTSRHVIHLDEEPDNRDIYSECMTRTMTTNGIILCTFTPLEGLSDVVLSFLPGGRFPIGGVGPVVEASSEG